MGRGRYNAFDDNDLISQIRELHRRIEDLEKGSGIGNTAIDAGDLSIRSGSLTVGTVPAIYMGPMVFGADTASGWLFRRNDGTVAFTIAGTASGNQNWELRDNAANVVVSDDDGDQGLARPYIHYHFVEHANTVPTITTTSATFVPLATGRYVKQHPYTTVEVLCRASDGSTSGQIQLYNTTTATVIDGPENITVGMYAVITLGPAVVDGAHMSYQELEIQVKRTAGAGTIGIRVMNAYGVETP